ncbi:MAG: general stress protein [Thermoanaerobaculia bacterium]
MSAHAGHATETTETQQKSAVIAIYDTHAEAEKAVRALEKSGFDLKRLSIVGKDYQTEEQVVGYYTTGDRMKAWGKTGAFWGGIWGLLFGSAFFLIPGIGPLFAAGPLVGWIVGALEGAALVGGFSALGAALASIGIPKDSILEYETQIKMGKYVVIAHGSEAEVSDTERALAATKHESIKKHSCCA